MASCESNNSFNGALLQYCCLYTNKYINTHICITSSCEIRHFIHHLFTLHSEESVLVKGTVAVQSLFIL
jgi:hypothetical protein